MASLAPWVELTLRDDEAFTLREVLSQTNAPDSFQSRMIQRLDAAIEESKRDRFPSRIPMPCFCGTKNAFRCPRHINPVGV